MASAVFVLGRRRWLERQPGEFAGAIRVPSGEVHGLRPKWKHGSGRWVRDVLVYGVKRLGDKPVVIEFASDGVKIQIATRARHRALATGPLSVYVT
jgi:hypothetical protein